MFDNKTILITGGTGSFGETLAYKFLKTDIGQIRIFSRDEKKQDDLRIKLSNNKVRFYLGDVRDISSIKTARILKAGDIENLSLILKELQDVVLTTGLDREMIKSSIKSYTWENYRKKVSNTCKKVLNK